MSSVAVNEKQLRAALQLLNQAARDYSWAFVERVFRDDETGAMLHNDPLQDEWHDLSAEYDRLIIMAFPESGKSTSITIGLSIWEMGHDHSLRFLVASKTYDQAVKVTSTCRELIEKSDAVHEVFPDLQSGSKWTDSEFTVKRAIGGRTPTMKAIGRNSSPMGLRIDRLIIDDLEDDENTRTPREREETVRWLDRTIFNRLTRRARVRWLTNDWHPKAACQQIAQRRRWHLAKYPVERRGEAQFPSRFPPERIQQIKRDVHPKLYAQLYLNNSSEDTSGQFKQEYVDKCKENGRGLKLVHSMTRTEMPPGTMVCSGVDLATGRKESRHSDLTVIFVALVYPNLHRRVLAIESGIWSGPEILMRLAGLTVRYPDVAVMVEDNGAQVYLMQFAEFLADQELELPPLYPWTTTGQKKWNKAFGVASVAVEMERGMWTYPSEEPTPECDVSLLECSEDLSELCQQAIDFTSDGAHTGDHLMAKWFCRELIRRFLPGYDGPGDDEEEGRRSELSGSKAGGF